MEYFRCEPMLFKSILNHSQKSWDCHLGIFFNTDVSNTTIRLKRPNIHRCTPHKKNQNSNSEKLKK